MLRRSTSTLTRATSTASLSRRLHHLTRPKGHAARVLRPRLATTTRRDLPATDEQVWVAADVPVDSDGHL